MEIHHDKHHAGYVNNLNKALESAPDLQSKSAEDLIKDLNAVPENIRTAVRNNGGGHVNHSMFWTDHGPQRRRQAQRPVGRCHQSALLAVLMPLPKSSTRPAQPLRQRLGLAVGRQERQAGGALHGQPRQPADGRHAARSWAWMFGSTPITSNIRTSRADYLKAWWNVVNWDEIAKRYAAAKGM